MTDAHHSDRKGVEFALAHFVRPGSDHADFFSFAPSQPVTLYARQSRALRLSPLLSSHVIPAKAGIHVLPADDRGPQVAPSRVRPLYQLYLPRPVPLLDLLLPPDGLVDVLVDLEVNQAMDPVAFGEPLAETAAVLPDPFEEVACHPRVEGAVGPAGQDVEGGLLRHRNAIRRLPLSRE